MQLYREAVKELHSRSLKSISAMLDGDEAHLLEDKALEELHTFCQDSMDYLILIFIGHPAIRQKLRRPATAAL